jgi:predicted nucleotidyltransferase
MKDIYRTNFEEVRQAYKNIFDALERAFKRFSIDFYLIGAQSRDVWTNHLPLDKRTTRDIDYCVYIKDHGTWEALNEYLLNKEGFTRDAKEPYRFYYGNTVDLIPFGGIEHNGEVILHNPTVELSVYGWKEVTEESVAIEGSFKVVTLPGLCIMKLIAFDEKPDRRVKDLDDFLFVLKNYGEIAGEQLFEGNYDDLIRENFEMPIAAARMLGRHIAQIANKNSALKEKIISILQNRLQGFDDSEIDQMYSVRDKDDKQVKLFKLISETVKGIRN